MAFFLQKIPKREQNRNEKNAEDKNGNEIFCGEEKIGTELALYMGK